MKKLILTLILAFLFASNYDLQSAELFSTFPKPDTWFYNQLSNSPDKFMATRFQTSSVAYIVDSIQVTIYYWPENASIRLFSDNSGNVNALVMNFGNRTVTNEPEYIHRFTPSSQLILPANTNYWLVAGSSSNNVQYIYTDRPVNTGNFSIPTGNSSGYFDGSPGPWQYGDSEYLIFKIFGRAAGPTAPTITGITSVDSQLSVSFTPPLSDNGSPVTNYEYSTNNGTNWTTRAPVSTTSPIVISGLTNGNSYNIRIRAVNANASGEQSNMLTGTPRTTPGAPSITSIIPGNQQLSVAFTAPGNNGGAVITNYEYSTDDGSMWTTRNPTSTASPILIDGLTNGTTYDVRIRAVNTAGSGTASDASQGTPRTVPDAPVITDFTSGSGQVSIAFTQGFDGGSSIVNYQYELNSGSWSDFNPNITSSPVTITGLNNSLTYNVRLKAVNAAGESVASNSIEVKLTPTTQATSIRFSNITRNSMTVRWTRGDGEGSVLLGRMQYRIPATPLTDGVAHTGNASYTAAPTVSGAKVLYFDTDANPVVNVTGLTRYQLVYYRVCEYNNGNTPAYLQTEASGNPSSRWTLRRDGLMEEDLTLDAEYPYPNPVANNITLILDVFEAGNVSAKLYDITGSNIIDLYNAQLPFGTHELRLDLSRVQSGTYQLVISKGSEAVVYPVSVVR